MPDAQVITAGHICIDPEALIFLCGSSTPVPPVGTKAPSTNPNIPTTLDQLLQQIEYGFNQPESYMQIVTH